MVLKWFKALSYYFKPLTPQFKLSYIHGSTEISTWFKLG